MSQSISIQLGNYANHVGSHIWSNRQELLGFGSSGTQDAAQGTSLGTEEMLFVNSIYNESVTRSGQYIPRALMIDFNENLEAGIFGSGYQQQHDSIRECFKSGDSLWGGNTQTIIRDATTSSLKNSSGSMRSCPESDSATVGGVGDYSNWTEFFSRKITLQPRTVYSLPQWATSSNFDSFFVGKQTDLVSAHCRDDILDRFRHLCEECDFLREIDLFVDLHNGFSGLGCWLLQELREECPSATIPVWAFLETDQPMTRKAVPHQPSEMNLSMSSLLRDLSVPMCYSELAEFASSVIPIDPRAAIATWKNGQDCRRLRHNAYETSSLVAAAIETIGSSRNISKRSLLPPVDKIKIGGETSHSCEIENLYCVKEWNNNVTNNGQFQFCSLEVAFPFPNKIQHSIDRVSASVLWETLNIDDRSTLNPFMSASLSASEYGTWSVSTLSKSSIHAKSSIFTNALSIRGEKYSDFESVLYRQYPKSGRLLSSVQCRQTPLLLHSKFPSCFRRSFSDETLGQMQHEVERTSCAAAVGSSSRMANHVENVMYAWLYGNCPDAENRRTYDDVRRSGATSGKVRAQLAKLGMNEEEIDEVAEKLRSITRKYETEVEL